MLRQNFLNKYREKSKYRDERFSEENESFLLKQNRPIKSNFLQSLKKEKVYKLIEDVLTNKKVTSVLYASNAKIEIKSYNKIKQNFYKKKDEIEKKLKQKNRPSSVVTRKGRNEAYLKMKNEIIKFKLDKEKHKRFLTERNNRKIKKLKEDVEKEKKEFFDDIRDNFIKGYSRAFDKLKFKLDILKSDTGGGGVVETEVDYPYAFDFTSKNITFPKPKLNIHNVYSRLYNNAILLPTDENNVKAKYKKRSISANRRYKIKNRYNSNQKAIPNYKLKNAILSNHGKEFTIKIDNILFRKCHNKYSGGPESINYLKTETEKKDIDENTSYFVNFNNLTEPKTGNSYLHITALENIPEMAQYFIDKGANLNMQNKEGNTPLHLALKCKNNKVIKILMDNKAALDIPNTNGEIPFEYFTSEMKREYGIDTMLVINPAKKK